MSIFTVLRYPISDQPKDEELGNLPQQILNVWLASLDTFQLYNSGWTQEEVAALRQIIREWEE